MFVGFVVIFSGLGVIYGIGKLRQLLEIRYNDGMELSLFPNLLPVGEQPVDTAVQNVLK